MLLFKFLNLSSLFAVFFTFFFCAATSPAALASANANAGLSYRTSPETWTNAQRLAAGLPPLAPRRFKRATPTEPGVARRAAPSPSPSAHVRHPHPYDGIRLAPVKTYTGTLQARTVSGNASLGFVRLSSAGVALGGDDNPSRVTFTAVGTTLPFNIATVAAGSEEPSFLGAVGKTALASDSASAAALSNVAQTPAHARPTLSGAESAIWTVDANTGRLSALWVNPDGSHANTVLASSGGGDGALVLTGDVDAYNRAHADAPVSEVALYFVSN